MFYNLSLQGSTYTGNTNFPGLNTVYTPLEPFSRQGGVILAIEATVPPSNTTTGPNVVDVGLYLGKPLDLNVLAGELLWASNNAVHYMYQAITGASQSQVAAIDETFQSFDPATRTLSIDIDPNTAPTTNFDHFIKSTSFLTAPTQIVAGSLKVQFSGDSRDVTGTATFFANAYIEPGSSAWHANFAGSPFDGLEYIASNPDLILAFGANRELGTQHFLSAGFDEGRQNFFDGLEYIASYADLILAFGANRDLGSQHYIASGIFEGRAADAFDAAQYLANYADLQAAFGSDLAAATQHYITNGFHEGRSDDSMF